MSAEVLLRARSGAEVGVGHVMRSRAVAQALAAAGARPRLVVDDAATAERLAADGFEAEAARDDRWSRARVAAAWLDGFADWSAEARELRRGGARVVLCESRGATRAEADLVVYPTLHHRPDAWDREHAPRVRAGAEWIPIAREAIEARRAEGPDADLLVSFGGADPFRRTERTVGELAESGWDGALLVSVGPRMEGRREAIAEVAAGCARAELVRGEPTIAPWALRARAVVTAVGTTLYELAHLGVPALVVANYAEDADALAHYAEHGPHVPVGHADALPAGAIARSIAAQLAGITSRAPRDERIAGGAARLARLLASGEG